MHIRKAGLILKFIVLLVFLSSTITFAGEDFREELEILKKRVEELKGSRIFTVKKG